MESIVDKIIEIDRMADSRINDARKKSDEILNAAEEKCRRLKNDIASGADKRIAEVEEINRLEYEKESEKLHKEYETRKNEMDSFFEANHADIEKNIFSEIVGEECEKL